MPSAPPRDPALPFESLSASGPFAALPPKAANAWFREALERRVAKGKTLASTSPPVALYAVLDGTLGVYREAEDGTRHAHDQLGPGAVVGGPFWPADLRLVAETDCRIAAWEPPVVAMLSGADPALSRAMEAFERERAAIRGLLAHEPFGRMPPAARRSLLRFARLAHASPGTAFIRQGEYTGDFYVILGGIVSAYRIEPDGTRAQLAQLRPGEWFGETSALSQQPSPAKLQADTACLYAVLAPGLFKELYAAAPVFRAAIDEGYRRRGLAIHLSIVPVLRDLPRDAVRAIQGLARFESVKKGAVVAAQGAPADSVYLVRSGALVTHVADAAGKRLTGYLMTNSSFGEHVLAADGAVWSASYSAMSDSDLLVLPAAQLRDALSRIPGALERLSANLAAQAAEDADAEELDVMAYGQSAKGGEALVIDLEKCVRCNACVESCVAVHADRVPRLSKRGRRVSAAANTLHKEISLVTSCYSCGTPGCMLACGYGAIRRNSRGLIRFLWDNCVGCAQCVQGCPYDVIRITPPPDQAPPPGPEWMAALPGVGKWLGGLFGPAAKRSSAATGADFKKDVEVNGKAVKCDRCEGLPFEACVYNCPTGAIERRSPAALFGRSTGPDGGR